MATLKAIRDRLELTQQALGAALDCSQSNISFYENGQQIPPDVARKLIAYAKTRGLLLTFDHVYGADKLPKPVAA